MRHTPDVSTGHKVRYFTTTNLVAPSTSAWPTTFVGKIVESLLRVDRIILDELGFATLDDGTQLLSQFVAGAYGRRSLAIGARWPSY